ncbi:type II CRISPR RNA-guided endonuclease Cas9 [Lachnospiraceae bacterium ZAX-1]
MKDPDWYLGLDIGTNSVGFSATDKAYNILAKGGKLQCGARLFEDAKDASERRSFRSLRRRFARRKVRIDLLQKLFDSEIASKDPSFFIRLNESALHLEDKSKGEKYPLFNDKDLTDKEHYKRFPTIYHLRKHLLENEEKDIRLLYLACHHLIKYRGHFLFQQFDTKRSNSGYLELIKSINEGIDGDGFDTANFADIPGIIKDKSKSTAKQWFEIKGKINPTGEKRLNAIFTAMQGNKIPLSKIWDDLGDAEKEIKEELKEFKFSSEKYDECLAAAEAILNDDQLGFLALLKPFYDLVQLDRVMAGASSISEAMVARYDEHKEDLKLLKSFIKQHLPDEYSKMFRQNTNYKDKGFAHASYVNYIGSNITHGEKPISHFIMCIKKGEEPMTATYDDFLKYTDSVIEKAKDKGGYQTLKEKIDNKTLCKIHNTQDNSYIPYQLGEAELRAILEKQKKNFPFLEGVDECSTGSDECGTVSDKCDTDSDEFGTVSDKCSTDSDECGTVSDKIVSLFTFRIPYYVGPLSEKDKGKFAWIEKNDGFCGQRVTPWNFEQVVDKVASGENFITRMTAKCTYLTAQDVIPKQSLLYQKYMLLQDLNNLKINGNRIEQKLKLFLYHGICQTENKLSKAKIKRCLVESGKIKKTDTVGKENENDTAFNASLSSQIKLRNILGENFKEELCEDMIKWHTVFGDEKKPVEQKLRAVYGKKLTEKQITDLAKLSFAGWARFSKKFLSEITATDKATGETARSIIKLLEDTTLNLMEILNSDHYCPKFLDTILKENAGESDTKVDYGLVKDLYCSPIVKRSIWQAILISKELTKINGCAPKKVFIEVTRGKDKKQKGKMKSSRRKQIEELLNKVVKDVTYIAALKREFDEKTDETEFRSDKLYLYFTQLGKCMYSGEAIVLDDLKDDSLYDIDHIYPQSKIKDDSFTNRVLVKRSANTDKTDKYPIEATIQAKQKSFWAMLKDKGFINAEKYSRLTCVQPLSNDMIGGFINRQLVSTNQAVKETANALKLLFGGDSKIVYSKAGNVSEFRHTHGLVKCREVNHLHHAHDAYLNIVVGNVWDSVYGQYWNTGITFNEDHALENLFKKDRPDIWQTAYSEKIESYLFDNKKYLNKFPVTTWPFEKKGAFYDQTIHPKGKGQFALHEGYDTAKYGGYKNGYNAYNCVIEYDEKDGKRIRGMFSVPVRFAPFFNDCNQGQFLEKMAENNKLADKKPTLIMRKIPIKSVLEVDGIRAYMNTGVTVDGSCECSVSAEWYPDKEIIKIIKDIFKHHTLVAEKQISAEDKETSGDIAFAKGKKISREDNLKVYDAIIKQITKPLYAKLVLVKNSKQITREKFKEEKTLKQVEDIIDLLNVIIANKKKADAIFKFTKKDKKAVLENSDVYLITQSVTGLFENRIVLNTKG